MSEPRYVHGGTDPREVARLEKQARFVAPFALRKFDAPPGSQVLDLATGVGAMAGVLLERFPGIALTGVDLNEHSLEQARKNHPGPTYLRADATALPFPDGTFDRVHCTWLLEHVPAPHKVLTEVRRVLKPGGYCQFTEVDNATFSTQPVLPPVVRAMEALNRAQEEGGGDPYVGQKLERLFKEAGFAKVDIHRNAMVGDARDPLFFQAFVDEFAEIFEGLDEALGPELTPTIHEAATALRRLITTPGGTIRYQSVVARGVK